MKKEFRNFDLGNLHLRNAEGEGEESRIIEGTAIVFGKRSVNMTPWSESREMYEVIEPSAISQELLNRCDIVLTYEHNFERVLGASVKGKGTLKLTRTDKGVDISCELGNSTDGSPEQTRVLISVVSSETQQMLMMPTIGLSVETFSICHLQWWWIFMQKARFHTRSYLRSQPQVRMYGFATSTKLRISLMLPSAIDLHIKIHL